VNNKRFVSDSIAFSAISALAVATTGALNLSIAIRFGAGSQADAFFLAYTVPGLVAGAMSTAMRLVLVPSFVRLVEDHRPAAAWRIILTIGMVGLLVWSVVALAGVIAAPLYIGALSSSISPGAQQLAIQISRWIFVIIPLTWLAGFVQAVLNSQRRFVLPLTAEFFANVVALSLIFTMGRRMGIMIVGLSFIAKAVLQIGLSALGLEWETRALGSVGATSYRSEIWTPLQALTVRLGAALLRQSSATVERFWSAFLDTGTVSSLSYAQMGVNMLSKVFSNSVATVLLPALSQTAWRSGKERQEATGDAMRLALFLTVPVAAFCAAFSYPVGRIVLAFSDTRPALVVLMSRLFAIYALRVPTLALISVLLAPFYALEDVRTPIWHMVLILGINLILDVLLFRVAGVYGFPLAAVLADAVSIARAFWLQKRVDVRYSIRSLGRDLTVILAGTGVAVLVASALYRGQTLLVGGKTGAQIISLGFATLLGGVTYLVTTRAAGMPEAVLVTTAAKTVCTKVLRR
jgi:putative peptidoglycan lipid II flippase